MSPLPLRRALLLACAGAGALTTPARADETRASADVSAGLGYSHNPFVGAGGGDSGFAQVGVSPEIRILNERRVVSIGGDVFYQDYFNDYRSTTSYEAHADYSDRVSENTSVHARASYASARLGTFGYGGLVGPVGGTLDPVVIGPTDPVIGVGAGAGLLNPVAGAGVLPGAEVGAFGAGTRQSTLGLNGDFSSNLSTRTSLTGSAFYLHSRYGNRGDSADLFGLLGDYDGYGGSLGAQRRLSDRTTVGLRASASAYNYQGGLQPDSRVYSLEGTYSTRLNTYWSLDASLGVTYLDQQFGGDDTTLSGSANLCRRGERSSFCLLASRQVLPTGYAGTRTQTSAGITWTKQTGENSNVSLAGSYVDLSGGGGSRLGPIGDPLELDDKYALADLAYSRGLGRRLRLSPSVYYRKVFGGSISRGDDYGGQVGLSYRLGDLR